MGLTFFASSDQSEPEHEPVKSEPVVRCAAYIRTDPHESLQSVLRQREVIEAYVQSQRHEGWRIVGARYEDRGVGGGSVQRPALQKLLRDAERRELDCVVVEQIPRLATMVQTFTAIISQLQKHKVPFACIHPSLNSRDSVSTLMLHIALSFHQYENEIRQDRFG